jgi:hypothetical protein
LFKRLVGVVITALGSLGILGFWASVALLVFGIALILHAVYDWWRGKRSPKNGNAPQPIPRHADRRIIERLANGRQLVFFLPHITQSIGSPRGHILPDGRVEKGYYKGKKQKTYTLSFKTTNSGEWHVGTEAAPKTLMFRKPHWQIVNERDLHSKVPMGDGYLVVKRFTNTGFVIEEVRTSGIEVEVEVEFKREGD